MVTHHRDSCPRGQRAALFPGRWEGHLGTSAAPALSGKLPVWVPALALVPCVVRPCPLSGTPFLIARCQGTGDRLGEWVPEEAVLADMHTQRAWALRLYSWTPAISGSALFILQVGDEARVGWARDGDWAVLAIPGDWAPPHTIIPGATAPVSPPSPAGPASPSPGLGGTPQLRAPWRPLCGPQWPLALSGPGSLSVMREGI